MPTYADLRNVTNSLADNKSTRKLYVNGLATQIETKVYVPEQAFQSAFAREANRIADVDQNNLGGSRRDIEEAGFEPKNDSLALIRIVTTKPLPSNNPAMQKGPDVPETLDDTKEFILQSVQEMAHEKYQLIETFGDPVSFFYGQRPKIYQYSGVLVNSTNKPWRDNWKDMYEKKLRGSELVKQKARVYLTYDYVLREGYILDSAIRQISAHPYHVDFNFTMFITREINLKPTTGTETERNPSDAQALQRYSDQVAQTTYEARRQAFLREEMIKGVQLRQLKQANPTALQGGTGQCEGSCWKGNSKDVPCPPVNADTLYFTAGE